MSILSVSRSILVMSDDGLHFYNVAPSGVTLADEIPWQTQDFEDAVIEVLKEKCKGSSVVLLNDMVEQPYRKERVPRVSAFDRANVLKRRVAAAFPSYPIRSALKLKEKVPARERGSVPSDIYLFAAVPMTDNVKKTLSALQRAHKTMAGFCLLPVESSSMVFALSKKLSKITDKPPVWTIFAGQHQSGGLRQIVTKNGELALTRMTPIVDSLVDQDSWTNDVYGELKGTMGYLSRFGFDPAEGLDLIVISNNSNTDRLASKIDFDCNLNILTVNEAANMLGLNIGRQDEQRYADPLHAAWVGRKKTFTLPMKAAQIDDVIAPARMALAASIVLAAGSAYLGYQAFEKVNLWTKNAQSLEQSKQRLALLTQEHAEELQKKESIGVDFLLIENSTTVFSNLEKIAMKPLPVFEKIGQALGPDIALQSMEVRAINKEDISFTAPAQEPAQESAVDPNAPAKPPENREFEVVLLIVFPAQLAPEVGVQKIAEVESRLKNALPDHDVSIIKQVADLSYTGNFVGEAGNTQGAGGQKEDYEAQILIRGSMI